MVACSHGTVRVTGLPFITIGCRTWQGVYTGSGAPLAVRSALQIAEEFLKLNTSGGELKAGCMQMQVLVCFAHCLRKYAGVSR